MKAERKRRVGGEGRIDNERERERKEREGRECMGEKEGMCVSERLYV